MEEKKLTDEELKKWLKVKPHIVKYGTECVRKGYEKAKEQIEQLTEELDFYKGTNRDLESMNEKLIAETRKLLEEKEELQKKVDELKTAKASYIKDLIEKTEKNTAKEIWNRAYKTACNTRGEITEKSIKDQAKRYHGVEVE